MNLRKYKTLVKLVKKEFFYIFKFKIANNNKYSKDDYLDAFLYLTQGKSAYCGSSQMKCLTNNTPDSDSLLYTLKKSFVKDFHNMLISITDKLLILCFKLKIFRKDHSFDVAIDGHEKPYYGDKNDCGVVGGKKEPHYVHKYLSIDIIERGSTFTIFAIPFTEVSTNKNLVNRLIIEAKKRIKINCLYADAEFMSAELIDIYEKNKVSYVVRAKNNYVYKIEKKHSKNISFVYKRKRYVNKNPIYTTTTWVINVFKKYDKIVKQSYYTNIKVTKRNIEQFHEQYHKRWNIEINYRTNNNFLPKTCAKAHVIRVFYFFLSIIMRNILTYINLLLKKKQNKWFLKKPIISSHDLVFLITIIDENT